MNEPKSKTKRASKGAAVIAGLVIVVLVALFVAVRTGSEDTSGKQTEQGEETASGQQTEQGEETDSTQQAEQSGETAAEQELQAFVAALSVGNINGSCVIWDKSGDYYILLTAAHVVEQEVTQEVTQVRLEGQAVQLHDYWVSSDYDLAFLAVQKKEDVALPELSMVQVMPEEETGVQSQDDIWVCGVTAQEKEVLTGKVLEPWIYVEDFGYHMLYGEAEGIKGGMSGGGVFDSRGRLVGMLLGSDGAGRIAALPVGIIAGEWDNCNAKTGDGFDLPGTLDIFPD